MATVASEIPWFRLTVWLAAATLLRAAEPAPAGPSPGALQEFDRYIRLVEAKVEASAGSGAGYLWADTAARRASLRKGVPRVFPAPASGRAMKPLPGGLIHDWTGAVFARGAKLDAVLAFVRDYDNHHRYYRPEVVRSRVLEHKGGQYRVDLRLRKQKGTVIVVLDTVHDVVYQRLAPNRWSSRSRSTRISEVRHPGGKSEHVLEPGRGRGYLWRLNSYWRFTEADGGVYIECEAVSLTRDIPAVVKVLVPLLRDLPKEELARTLKITADPAGRRR